MEEKDTGPEPEEDHEKSARPHSLPARVVGKRTMALRPDIADLCVAGPWLEEYNRLQQNIVSVLPDVNPRRILFAGVSGDEGSETVVSRLGVVLSMLGRQVLLVDTQVRDPVLHQIFGIERAPGTIELLSSKCTLVQVIHRTKLDRLFVIPGGSSDGDPFFLQQMETFDYVTDTMKGFADWIILSCHAVNAYNDATTIARKVHGVVLVVQAEKTRWEVAQSAKARLEKAGANILGVVLNDRRYHIPEWIYKRL
jgi:capsular exopolysaccharide synthesis family protein